MFDIDTIVNDTVRYFQSSPCQQLSDNEGDLLYAIVTAQHSNKAKYAQFSVTSNSSLSKDDVRDLIIKNDVTISKSLLSLPTSSVDYFDELLAEESGINALVNKVYQKLKERGNPDEMLQMPLSESRMALGQLIQSKLALSTYSAIQLNLITSSHFDGAETWVNPLTGIIKGCFCSPNKWIEGNRIFIDLINLARQNHKLNFTLTLWGSTDLKSKNEESSPLVTALVAGGTVKEHELNTNCEEVVYTQTLNWDEKPLPQMGVPQRYFKEITAELNNRLMLVNVDELTDEFIAKMTLCEVDA